MYSLESFVWDRRPDILVCGRAVESKIRQHIGEKLKFCENSPLSIKKSVTKSKSVEHSRVVHPSLQLLKKVEGVEIKLPIFFNTPNFFELTGRLRSWFCNWVWLWSTGIASDCLENFFLSRHKFFVSILFWSWLCHRFWSRFFIIIWQNLNSVVDHIWRSGQSW